MLLENIQNPYHLGYIINIPFWTGAWYSPFSIKKVAILFRGKRTSLVGVLNKSRKSIQEYFVIPNKYVSATRDGAYELRNRLMPKSMDLVVILDTRQLEWKYSRGQVRDWSTTVNGKSVVLGTVIKRVRDELVVDINGDVEYRIKSNGVLVVNETENIVRGGDSSRCTINYDVRLGFGKEIPIENVMFGDHFTTSGNKFGISLCPNDWVFHHVAEMLDHIHDLINHGDLHVVNPEKPYEVTKAQQVDTKLPIFLDKDTGLVKNIRTNDVHLHFRDLIW